MPVGGDTMKTYMQQIGMYPLIPKDEEVALADRIADGSDDAREKLIQSNLRLVVKIAHDFKGLGLPLLDLISEGNIGLMRAAEKFDPRKGAKFSSYAAWWIKQSMRLALANQSRAVRVPVQSAAKMNKIKYARNRLHIELGREPTDAEIARRIHTSARSVSAMRRLDARWVSLQDPIQLGEIGNIEDLIPDSNAKAPDEWVYERDALRRLGGLLHRLNQRESTVLRLRFGLDGAPPRTLDQTSAALGRTRERVRQIQNQALAKLRQFMEEDDRESEIPGSCPSQNPQPHNARRG